MPNPINMYKKIALRREIASAKLLGRSLRLVVGAGGTRFTGWISIEKTQIDITKREDIEKFFSHGDISNILAEHVIEHIERDDFERFLGIIRPFLRSDAVMRFAVPDALHPSGYVRELTMPGGLEPGAEDHRYFYNINIMREIALQAGYELAPIEYFDESGNFHFREDDWSNGYIARSSKNYQGRFTNNKEEWEKMINSIPSELREEFINRNLSYTSLVVDFLVPQ